jgi:hypothetical protein
VLRAYPLVPTATCNLLIWVAYSFASLLVVLFLAVAANSRTPNKNYKYYPGAFEIDAYSTGNRNLAAPDILSGW